MKISARRGRPREFDREKVLAIAVKRFWLLGFDATSMRDLAEAMSISQPSIYSSFTDKSALYLEAIDTFEQDVALLDMSLITEASDLSDGVYRFLNQLLKRVTKSGSPKGCMILGGAVADLSGQRHLVLYLRARRRAFEAALSVALQTWLPLAEARTTAAIVTIFARGLSVQARDGETAALLRTSVAEFCRRIAGEAA